VIGEDGRDGIQLSSDTLPGAYFREFQRAILDLHARGVAVALCSKNDEADVFDVLDHHPDCLIRREHLAAWRINWNDKAHSIGEIADELNLGLDSLVFVDDSPQECALVTHALPAVLVRRTPIAPAELVNFLGREGLFDALEVTAEDLERTRTYQQTRERNEYASSMDMVEYKAQLQTHLYVRTAMAADVARVTQLLQRTNQFNLTTRRRDPVEVRRLLDDPDVRVLCARLTDRFGDLGVIAAAIVLRRGSEAVVDSMLMSCRALGRDAELAFASSVYAAIDRAWKPDQIRAEYVRTERNSLVADFWERAGLMRDSESPHGATYQSVGNLSALAKALSPPDVTVEEGVDGQ
jgi:FkbH-like protein